MQPVPSRRQISFFSVCNNLSVFSRIIDQTEISAQKFIQYILTDYSPLISFVWFVVPELRSTDRQTDRRIHERRSDMADRRHVCCKLQKHKKKEKAERREEAMRNHLKFSEQWSSMFVLCITSKDVLMQMGVVIGECQCGECWEEQGTQLWKKSEIQKVFDWNMQNFLLLCVEYFHWVVSSRFKIRRN